MPFNITKAAQGGTASAIALYVVVIVAAVVGITKNWLSFYTDNNCDKTLAQ